MTILVGRRGNSIASGLVDMFDHIGEKKEDAERRRKRNEGARVRRFAKKHGLVLRYHRRPWLYAVSDSLAISMPPGYFATVKRVIHKIVC